MRRRPRVTILLFCIMLVMLFQSSTVWPAWYPGRVHAHSTFSDGDRLPTILKGTAIFHHSAFLIVTDHFEQIPKKRKFSGIISDDYGFEKYLASFQSSPELVIIAGAEISLPRQGASSHVLAIGNLRSIINQSSQSPRDLVKELGQKGLLAIAAHPNQKSATSNFIFDVALTQWLNGIEMFNESQAAQKKTLAWYLQELASGRDLFVIAGVDSHTSADPTDLQRWSRITYVWVDGSLTARSLFEALKNGRTYASQGAELTDLNYLPGFVPQEVSRPKFSFVIHFAHKLSQAKQVRIYRKGNPQPAGVIRLAAGKTEYHCLWEDKEATQGQHRYVLELENLLITSPITLSVKSPSQDKDQKTKLTPAAAFYLGTWEDKNEWWSLTLKITPGFFDLELKNKGYSAGITQPEKLNIHQGTWHHGARGQDRIAGTCIGDDGAEWTLDVWQDSPKRIGFSIIRQKPNFMGFFAWPYRAKQ